MIERGRRVVWMLVAGAVAGCGGPATPRPAPRVPVFTAQGGYARVAAEIVDWHLTRHPALATRVGEHAHDEQLPPAFPGDLEQARRDAHALLTRLGAVNRPTLDRPDFLDYRLLGYGVRAELQDLESIGGWQRDPVRYMAAIQDGLRVLYDDATLGPDARLDAAAARLNAAPLLYRAARQNLDASRVPPLYARMAFEDARRLSRALTVGDSPPGTAGASARARDAWVAARRVAVAATDSFATWLDQTLIPAARGDFRLGGAVLADYLLYQHHVGMPLDEMQAVNRRAIAEYREWLEREALQFDPMRHPRQIVDSLVAATPGGSVLIRPEALPGVASGVSIVRQVFPAPATAAAWAHFSDVRLLESEAASAADRLLAIARALHGHALLHGMLALHGADATVDGVAENIAGIAFIGRDAAHREAERLAYDPGYGLPALGRMQLFALREQLRAERGSISDAEFAQAVLGLGLPIQLTAEALLGREPIQLLGAEQRTPGVPEPPRIMD